MDQVTIYFDVVVWIGGGDSDAGLRVNIMVDDTDRRVK